MNIKVFLLSLYNVQLEANERTKNKIYIYWTSKTLWILSSTFLLSILTRKNRNVALFLSYASADITKMFSTSNMPIMSDEMMWIYIQKRKLWKCINNTQHTQTSRWKKLHWIYLVHQIDGVVDGQFEMFEAWKSIKLLRSFIFCCVFSRPTYHVIVAAVVVIVIILISVLMAWCSLSSKIHSKLNVASLRLHAVWKTSAKWISTMFKHKICASIKILWNFRLFLLLLFDENVEFTYLRNITNTNSLPFNILAAMVCVLVYFNECINFIVFNVC